MVTRLPHYCVVGGGVSGLTTAYLISLLRPTGSYRLTLLEARSRYGGWIHSFRNPNTGAVYELGPHSARASGSSSNFLLRLALSLDLQKSILWMSTNQDVGNRYIYVNGRLTSVSPLSIFASDPFTRSPLGLVIKRALSRAPPLKSDLSVDEFLRTRFDDEFADYLGSAIIRGVYAGDSRRLSARACLPQLIRYEESGPNLIIGMLKAMLGRKPSNVIHIPEALNSQLPLSASSMPSHTFAWSLTGGMEQLTDALSSAVQRHSQHVTLRPNSDVQRIVHPPAKSNSFTVIFKDESNNESSLNDVDAVFLCCSSYQSGQILREAFPPSVLDRLSLDRLPWTDVAVAVLELEGKSAQPPVRGFGHLVPRLVDPHVLGIVYDSVALPLLDSGKGSVRYTVMMTPKSEWLNLGTEDLERSILSESLKAVQTQLKISNPQLIDSKVTLLRNCIPQYPLHHVENIKSLRDELMEQNAHAKSPRIHLVGFSYDGVGLGDAAFSALSAVQNELQLSA